MWITSKLDHARLDTERELVRDPILEALHLLLTQRQTLRYQSPPSAVWIGRN